MLASETLSSHLGSTSLLPSPHAEIPSWQVGCSNSAQTKTETAQTGCGGEQADVTRVVEEGGQTGGYWQNQGCLSQEQWVLRISPSLSILKMGST